MSSNHDKYKIAIIGAGMAGLGAAITLCEQNIEDFIILEAMPCAGGRISTTEVNGGVIELGAQWLHANDNRLYEILDENNLIHPETSDEGLGIFIRDDGVIFDQFLVKKIDYVFGDILDKCAKFVNCETNVPKSVGHFLQEEFKLFLENSNYTDDEKIMIEQLYDWNVRFHLIDHSCADLKKISAKAWGRYSYLGKNGQSHINIKSGYGNVVKLLVEMLPPDCIKYETPVSSISLDQGLVEIKTSDDIIYSQHVIITCSLGVLKTLDFPKDFVMKTTIENMGFGGMGKVFLEFSHRWWKHEGFQCLWRREAITKENEWLTHFSGFESVLSQPNILVGWISHLGVEQMERLDEETVGKECVRLLRMFLQDDSIPDPVRTYKTSWITNSFVKGAYSHTTTDCDNGPLPTAWSLMRPFCDENNVPRILLAGEAIHESRFSTTHGAFESGQMQCQKLIEYINV